MKAFYKVLSVKRAVTGILGLGFLAYLAGAAITIIDFKRIEEIPLGSTEQEVRRRLGDPDGVTSLGAAYYAERRQETECSYYYYQHWLMAYPLGQYHLSFRNGQLQKRSLIWMFK